MANKAAYKIALAVLPVKFAKNFSGSGTLRPDKSVSAFRLIRFSQTIQTEPDMAIKRPLCNYSGTIQELAVGDTLTGSTIVSRETPSGTKNGINTDFTLANTPVLGSEQLYVNGILMHNSNDYVINAATITFVTAPALTDIILVTYWR